ncbi:GlsB/YeaQ/YmgE family stress response membrane protein [Leptolyngbya sp. FACHB-261]|uniref:GlsB/YeaQ/YmgE family stress response membrane protein n=1 Tax=Leptolyngbya sp. FACHB-261 TaxID=2692806 RepID=UPI0016883FE6|nr:GlsB/YeaQ/YmgE family stress response membrane protein [Leptolyngbya sp. FACHB-261]MBD2102597.1 GlsB/YeaQ/YmgE family stress response membrane protein [Leptolyngbya sp. FACHB-261]
MSILSWVLVGIIAGAIAKAVYPGHQGGGILATVALGILGALIGGFVGSTLLGIAFTGFNIQGLLVAIIGACILLFLYGLVTRSA